MNSNRKWLRYTGFESGSESRVASRCASSSCAPWERKAPRPRARPSCMPTLAALQHLLHNGANGPVRPPRRLSELVRSAVEHLPFYLRFIYLSSAATAAVLYSTPNVSSQRLSQEDYSDRRPNHPTTLRFNTEVQNEAILALVGQGHVWCGPTPKPPPSP